VYIRLTMHRITDAVHDIKTAVTIDGVCYICRYIHILARYVQKWKYEHCMTLCTVSRY